MPYEAGGSVCPSPALTRPPSRACAEDTTQVVACVRDPSPTCADRPGMEVGSPGQQLINALSRRLCISVLFLSVLLVRLFCFLEWKPGQLGRDKLVASTWKLTAKVSPESRNLYGEG